MFRPEQVSTNRQCPVLQIDEDREFCEFTAKHLAEAGFPVESSQDSRLWQRELIRGKFRVVLLDLHSHAANDFKILRDIKEHDEGVRVIGLTDALSFVEAMECLRNGTDYCFFKPITDFTPVVQSLEDVFRRTRHWQDCFDSAARHRREHLLSA